jgi:hypothetical protein
MSAIETLQKRALTLAGVAQSAEEVKIASEYLKTIAEHDKIVSDIKNQQKLLKSEFWKTLSTAIVPLLTLLTLAVTIYFQYAQAQLTSAANEDAQWRTVLDVMTKPPGRTSDIVKTSSLIPFYDSKRYKSQAYAITFLLVRKLSDFTEFRTLFDNAFVSSSWENAADMVRLAGLLDEAYTEINEKFEDLGGIDGLKSPKKPVTLVSANHQRNDILDEEHFIANQIGDILRSSRPRKNNYINFTNIPFFEANLENANFLELDISNSFFQRVNLDGAILSPIKFDHSIWNGTKWWKAKEISPEMLKYLIDNAAPYSKEGEFYPGEQDKPLLMRDDYAKIVENWCKKTAVSCDLDHLPFGKAATMQSPSTP